jgi:hypothetical protein
MPRRRIPRFPGAVVAATMLLPLAGCGENSIESYCKEVSAHREELAEMVESTDASALLSHLPMLRDLAESAPEDIADKWQVFNGALGDLDQAIKDAGVKPSDFEDGQPPAGVSAAERKAIADAAAQIRTDDVVEAATGIEQQARDVCKVNFGV